RAVQRARRRRPAHRSGDAQRPRRRHADPPGELGTRPPAPRRSAPRSARATVRPQGGPCLDSASVFDTLSEKLQTTLNEVRQRGTLTEDDVNAAMREIRL